MANELYRMRIQASIAAAKYEYELASKLNHHGLMGRVREIAVDRLLRPWLPAGIGLGTGQIVDHEGNQSKQVDVVIFDPKLLSPLMYDQCSGSFPVEACLAAIEVKSTLDAAKCEHAVEVARSVANLKLLPVPQPKGHPQSGKVFIQTFPLRVACGLFAFKSDLAEMGKSEFDRFREHDSNCSTIDAICIPERGLWRRDEQGWGRIAPTPESDEVIGFVGMFINSLADIALSRGWPRLGHYLFKDLSVARESSATEST